MEFVNQNPRMQAPFPKDLVSAREPQAPGIPSHYCRDRYTPSDSVSFFGPEADPKRRTDIATSMSPLDREDP
jgi:hypothetical protein